MMLATLLLWKVLYVNAQPAWLVPAPRPGQVAAQLAVPFRTHSAAHLPCFECHRPVVSKPPKSRP